LKTLAPATRQLLEQYSWPGNIRELENVIERAVLLSKDPMIEPQDLPANLNAAMNSDIDMAARPASLKSALAEPEKRLIFAALEAHNWNRQQTADALKLNRATLYKKMKRYGLEI